jgi:hypothetical protein
MRWTYTEPWAPAAVDDPLPPRTAVLILLAILLFAAAVRIIAFRGFLGLDDGEYARLGNQIAQGINGGRYDGPSVFPLRVGLTVPAALAFKAFGVGEWPLVLYPFAISLCTVVLAYCSASVLFDRRAGLIAAAFSAAMTWQVEAATTLLPDLPGAFFSTAGVTLLLVALRHRTASGRWLGIVGLAAGLSFGVSWLNKETVLYTVPFCGALMALSIGRRSPRGLAVWTGVAAGALLVFATESVIYALSTGDFLFRFHETERNYTQNAKYFFTEGSVYGWKTGESFAGAVRRRLLVTGPEIIFLNRQALYLPLFAGAATIYGAWRRDRRFLIPSLWFWSLVLMFNFASSSTETYRPLVLFNRYLLPVFLAATISAAGLLATLLWPRGRQGLGTRALRAAGFAVAASFLWFGATEIYFQIKYRPTWWAAEVRTLARSVEAGRPLLADTLTLRGLEFFAGYPGTRAWTDFEQVDPAADVSPGTTVIVNRRYIQWLETNGGLWGSRTSGYPLPSRLASPPPEWRIVWHNDNAVEYRVEPAGAVVAAAAIK